MNPIVIVLVFLTVVLGAEGLYLTIRGNRRADPSRVRARLRRLAGNLQAEIGDQRGNRSSIVRGIGAGRRSLASLAMQLVPRRETLEILLYRAGMPISMHRFVLVSAVFAAAGWMGASALTDDMRLGSIGLGACLVPWLVVRRIASKRMAEFESQFPDALSYFFRGP